MSYTHLDIAYAVNMASQFMHASEPTHFEAAYRIFRFLKESTREGVSL